MIAIVLLALTDLRISLGATRESRTLELPVRLLDGELVARLDVTLECDGRFYLLAPPCTAARIRLESTSPARVVDEHSAYAVPYATAAVDGDAGSTWSVTVRCAEAFDGRVQVLFSASPPAARALAVRVRDELARIEALRATGGAAEANAALDALMRATWPVAAGEDADELVEMLERLADAGAQVGNARLAAEILAACAAQTRGFLPAAHARTTSSSSQLARALWLTSDVDGARAALTAACSALEPFDCARARWIDLRENEVMLRAMVGGEQEAYPLLTELVAERERTPGVGADALLRARINLASIASLTGNRRHACDLRLAALESVEDGGRIDPDTLAGLFTSLANADSEVGAHERARLGYERALAILVPRYGTDHADVVYTRHSLAESLVALGELESAERVLLEVVASVERVDGSDNVQALRCRATLASLLQQRGEYERAFEASALVIEGCERTFPPDHPFRIDADAQHARLLFTRAGFDDAQALLRSVVERSVRPGRADALQRIHARAWIGLCDEMLGLDERATLVQRLHQDLRVVLEDRDRPSSARTVESLVGTLRAELGIVLSLAAGTGRTSHARDLDAPLFDIVELLRSAPLVAARPASSALDAAEDAALLELQRRTRDLASALSGSSDDVAEKGRRVGYAHEALQQVRARLAPPPAEPVRLAPGEALVGYWSHPRLTVLPADPAQRTIFPPSEWREHLSAFVRTAASTTWIDLGPAAEIETATTEWLRALRSSGSGAGVERGLAPREEEAEGGAAEHALGSRVHALVVAPLLDALGDAERVHVELDGPLVAIPFDALPVGEGHRLADVRELRFIAGSQRRARRPAAAGASTVVAFGGVAHARAFAALPATLEEVTAIAAAFEQAVGEPGRAIVRTGTGADLPALLAFAPQATYLHLATHGWSNLGDRDPARAIDPRTLAFTATDSALLLSGLALAPSKLEPSGAVTAEELAALDLSRCELAVLSACETGVGSLTAGGHASASLQHALFLAGAQSVMASLWAVPDEATGELVADVYRAIWTDGVEPPAALARAKLAARERGRAPRDWAGWMLVEREMAAR